MPVVFQQHLNPPVIGFDALDVEGMICNDAVWFEPADDDHPIVLNIECAGHAGPRYMSDGELAEYVRASREACKLPFSANGAMIAEYVRATFEREARRRIERFRRRNVLRNSERVRNFEPWQTADLLAEVEAVTGPLQRRGRDYWACCPFHEERTPSFHVDPDRRVWRCFGCGAGGGVVAFRRAIEGRAA